MQRPALVSLIGIVLAACAGNPPAPGTSSTQPAAAAQPAPAAQQVMAPAPTAVDFVAEAIADSNRPADDTERDAQRKPADMLAFAQVQPGQHVVDLIPGSGYFTRLLARAVGADGHVYAAAPAPGPDSSGPSAIDAITANPSYANVSNVLLAGPLSAPEPVDMIWTAQNYHDLHLTQLKIDIAAMNKSFFDALKPGGLLVIVDHSAVAGTGLDVPNTLHRIDEEIVKREVTAAGFVLESSSDVLRNPADARTLLVFDPAIKGNTDQFVLRFRKPR